MIVDVTKYLELCEKHAEEIINDGISLKNFRNRNQNNLEKIKKQIRIGKLGEFGVYELLNTSYPDLSITSSKSYSADLFAGEKRLHVKTCAESMRSWIFQVEDPLTYDPHPLDFIVLCYYKEAQNKIFIEIKQILKATLAVELNLFKEPFVDKLKGIKKAIYLDDILSLKYFK